MQILRIRWSDIEEVSEKSNIKYNNCTRVVCMQYLL